jgi:L-alanine-DL-glutamate epimerase-like enolase superfamily enzyme
MSEAAVWDALSRLEQRALIKLFGGGTLRSEAPAVVSALRARSLVDENDGLAMSGLFVMTLAIGRHQRAMQFRPGSPT